MGPGCIPPPSNNRANLMHMRNELISTVRGTSEHYDTVPRVKERCGNPRGTPHSTNLCSTVRACKMIGVDGAGDDDISRWTVKWNERGSPLQISCTQKLE